MRLSRAVLTIAFALLGSATALSDDAKDEIRIGQTLPYSGPASGFGIIGRAQEAYFERSTPKAASTAARSSSSAWMTPIPRPKRWSRPENSSSRRKCC